jgi:hypothetical protein
MKIGHYYYAEVAENRKDAYWLHFPTGPHRTNVSTPNFISVVK